MNDLLARADFITLHVPMTPETRNILSADAIAKTKKGVRIINCARGGLIDEYALKAAMDNGHVAGAALDVFRSSRQRKISCSAATGWWRRHIWALPPAKRRRMWPCRWQSRFRIIC